jgi:hypothetical protein
MIEVDETLNVFSIFLVEGWVFTEAFEFFFGILVWLSLDWTEGWRRGATYNSLSLYPQK